MVKDAMLSADNFDLLVNEQYKSRLYMVAIYLATNKCLVYDVFRQMTKLIAVCSNNARSCYDRIIHIAAFLALRQLRIPKLMIIRMLHTIQVMEHVIRISFDDSTEIYSGSE